MDKDMDVELKIESLIKHFTETPFNEEVQIARRVFFENAGVLDEKHEQFDQRMAQFLDWYLFTRPQRNGGRTPLKMVLQEPQNYSSLIEPQEIKALAEYRHSLFEYLKIKGEDLYLYDLFTKTKIIVRRSPWIFGFDRNAMIEARLILYENNHYFSKGICIHPPEARSFILKQVKKCRKQSIAEKEALLLKLLKLCYKFNQYRHVKLESIYTPENLEKV